MQYISFRCADAYPVLIAVYSLQTDGTVRLSLILGDAPRTRRRMLGAKLRGTNRRKASLKACIYQDRVNCCVFWWAAG